MTDAEQRQQRGEAIDIAWSNLATNEDLKFLIKHDLKKAFAFHVASFQKADGFNSNAAALRDGNKEVINFITGRLAQGRAMLGTGVFDSRPTEAKSEYQGTPPP